MHLQILLLVPPKLSLEFQLLLFISTPMCSAGQQQYPPKRQTLSCYSYPPALSAKCCRINPLKP